MEIAIVIQILLVTVISVRINVLVVYIDQRQADMEAVMRVALLVLHVVLDIMLETLLAILQE